MKFAYFVYHCSESVHDIRNINTPSNLEIRNVDIVTQEANNNETNDNSHDATATEVQNMKSNEITCKSSESLIIAASDTDILVIKSEDTNDTSEKVTNPTDDCKGDQLQNDATISDQDHSMSSKSPVLISRQRS